MLVKPQPYSDIELGKICRWLVRNGYTCHATRDGEVELIKREPGPEDDKSVYRAHLSATCRY